MSTRMKCRFMSHVSCSGEDQWCKHTVFHITNSLHVNNPFSLTTQSSCMFLLATISGRDVLLLLPIFLHIVRGHVAIITKPSPHYIITQSTISGRDVVLLPGLLPVFLHGYEIKSGWGLGTRLCSCQIHGMIVGSAGVEGPYIALFQNPVPQMSKQVSSATLADVAWMKRFTTQRL